MITPVVEFSDGTNVFFSNGKAVAIETPETMVVSQNPWPKELVADCQRFHQTNKHLDAIDGGKKADRISPEAFANILATLTVSVTLPDPILVVAEPGEETLVAAE
jgi:hypothetical protein